MEPILTSIAGKLAGTLSAAVVPKAKAAILGSDEQRAVDRAFRSAFAAMLADVRAGASWGAAADDVLATAETQLNDFVADGEAATALFEVALERRSRRSRSCDGASQRLGSTRTRSPSTSTSR